MRCHFDKTLTAGMSTTVPHRLASTLPSTAGGGGGLTVANSTDQRHVKTEGQSPICGPEQSWTAAAGWGPPLETGHKINKCDLVIISFLMCHNKQKENVVSSRESTAAFYCSLRTVNSIHYIDFKFSSESCSCLTVFFFFVTLMRKVTRCHSGSLQMSVSSQSSVNTWLLWLHTVV